MTNAVTNLPRRSVVADMADRYGMEPDTFEQTLRKTVVPRECTKEEFAAFLLVAKQYGLNPITREIYAFPKQGGGIQPIVSVDGWANLINSHSAFDGMTFEDHLEDGKLIAVTCRMHRKDRAHPTEATEYMEECLRTDRHGKVLDVWAKWPRRMLRHKAVIQAARYAFGFAGIVDPDEAERFTVTPSNAPPPPPTTVIPKTETAAKPSTTSQGGDAAQGTGAAPSPLPQAPVPAPFDSDAMLREAADAFELAQTRKDVQDIMDLYAPDRKHLAPEEEAQFCDLIFVANERIEERGRKRVENAKSLTEAADGIIDAEVTEVADEAELPPPAPPPAKEEAVFELPVCSTWADYTAAFKSLAGRVKTRDDAMRVRTLWGEGKEWRKQFPLKDRNALATNIDEALRPVEGR